MATTGKSGPAKPKARRKTAAAKTVTKRARKASVLVEEAQIIEDDVLAEDAAPVAIAAEMAAAPRESPLALVQIERPAIRPASSPRAVWLAVGAATFVAIGALVAQHAHRSESPVCAAPAPLEIAASFAPAPAPPSAAEALRADGHRLFVEGRRPEALRAYERALRLDSSSADARMLDDLLQCYGRKDSQPEAAALIARFQLREAAARLEALTARGSHGTRWGAIYTLERLDHVPRRTYVNAFIADLEAPSCDVRRRAAARLSTMDSPRGLAALRQARRRPGARCLDQASAPRKDRQRG